ncbi:MAG: ATP-binding cassette domain-containing protein [Paracoccus sp. (in: a-proteobacteria)]|uniref:ATP-binding cassette domain-containing protein n=1 Tax=unclassified Paracoccus (in: a-proteobacteria) TaxID=2688777 RepID=UPI000C6AB92E|nr:MULTISPECIES: ATP-binding cassette domain-containing protein [unclassified Paracoccus (in: a-proteobacteria)]MAN57915.1 ABC transporter ATP-binding protein [Paracoccus sp. (in: a-proteobacteria)]MBA47446.1 ABC transporter ATP-binding protein [Paracoccus sp. (in: a-proteobacteria)]MCS5600852.1 ATP-binding cassette domain-containing protein [Paracoccus sp. (in: a-proteobacteria)]|tara:strand:+ start:3026 stop:3622 length:597 start_codon:yes stop_codon:yes gene_type:complete
MRIELRGKSFAGRAVLGPIRLTIGRGRRVAVLGPSGIGKSTLLRIVAGLDRDFDGQAEGDDRLAVVFQEPTLLPWRRALDNITIAAGCDAAVGRDLMAQVGLAGREDQFPRQMSLGQQRRLALARAFAARPDILLMDEPFASLDPETATRMIRLAAGLLDRSGAGLFLVTHDAGEPARLEAQVFRLSGHPAVLQRDRD